MSTAWLSLGSNVAPEKHLRTAVAALRDRFGAVRVSPVYRSPAVGFNGPDFLNCAAAVDTDLEPAALDAWLHALEDAHGRRRDVPRFSDRTLDIDIVLFDDRIVDGPGHLRIPRDELRHAFVLKPLCDLAPGLRAPGDDRTLAERWQAIADDGGLQRLSLDL